MTQIILINIYDIYDTHYLHKYHFNKFALKMNLSLHSKLNTLWLFDDKHGKLDKLQCYYDYSNDVFCLL